MLLKNDGHTLPLHANAPVLVTGPGANDIGRQAGGWSVDWQGDHNSNADFPGATSIFDGIRVALEAGGGHAEWTVDGTYTERPDVAIVVFGERPYAEYDGDRESLLLGAEGDPGLDLIRRLHEERIPVVAVLLSGRPLWMNRELDASDAFVAAWLPGSEGRGVADVLVGHADGTPRYDFTGRLPFTWSRTALPVQSVKSDRSQGVLFARGFGSITDRLPVGSFSARTVACRPRR